MSGKPAPSPNLPERRAPGPLRLGLIGDNIKRSRSPDLHRLAGRLTGLEVTYDLFIPRDMGRDFAAVFEMCRAEGISGVNITYPYKEQVVEMVEIADPLTARMGSANTVLFENGGAFGHNTDYSGFVAAYRAAFPEMTPGKVLMIGAGGVGKAVAFGLVSLGAEHIAIVDRDADKARALAAAVAGAGAGKTGSTHAAEAMPFLAGVDGIVNCTPLGMVGYPGSPVPAERLGGQRWAFDAVYTPVQTEFKRDAEAAGLAVLSGYELFFHQGIQAFEIFTGRMPEDLDGLRNLLSRAERQGEPA